MSKQSQEAVDELVNQFIALYEETVKYGKCDKTYSGTILEVLGDNKYKVRYNGGEYTLFDRRTFVVNDNVWVRIPCGNENLAYIDNYNYSNVDVIDNEVVLLRLKV